jgi:hypothetical protein
MSSKKILSIAFIAILVSFAISACQKENICSLKPEIGPCFAIFTKYYFDHSTNKCEEFTWGGCDGVVPFETKVECEMCGCK